MRLPLEYKARFGFKYETNFGPATYLTEKGYVDMVQEAIENHRLYELGVKGVESKLPIQIIDLNDVTFVF